MLIDNRYLYHPEHLPIRFTPSESRVFCALLVNVGKLVTYEDLFEHLYWGRAVETWPEMDSVKVQIWKMRQKLVATDIRLESVWGSGYFIPNQ